MDASIAFALGNAEVHDLEFQARERTRSTFRRLVALQGFVERGTLPREHGQSVDWHTGFLGCLADMLMRSGSLVTGLRVISEVTDSAYAWAQWVGLTPMIWAVVP